MPESRCALMAASECADVFEICETSSMQVIPALIALRPLARLPIYTSLGRTAGINPFAKVPYTSPSALVIARRNMFCQQCRWLYDETRHDNHVGRVDHHGRRHDVRP